jgi:hypothetical protein
MLGKIPGKECFNRGSISFLYLLDIQFFSNYYKETTAGSAHVYWIPLLFHHSHTSNMEPVPLYALSPVSFLVCSMLYLLLLHFAISTYTAVLLFSVFYNFSYDSITFSKKRFYFWNIAGLCEGTQTSFVFARYFYSLCNPIILMYHSFVFNW